MSASATILKTSWSHALFTIGITHRLYKRFHRAGGGCVAQEDPVNAGGQHLLEHP